MPVFVKLIFKRYQVLSLWKQFSISSCLSHDSSCYILQYIYTHGLVKVQQFKLFAVTLQEKYIKKIGKHKLNLIKLKPKEKSLCKINLIQMSTLSILTKSVLKFNTRLSLGVKYLEHIMRNTSLSFMLVL